MSEEETPNKPTPKKIITSLVEFRAWLEGIEEMQEDNWTPTPTQWKRIREKIQSVVATPNLATPIVPHLPPSPNYPVPQQYMPPVGSSLDYVNAPPPAQNPIMLNPEAPIARGQQQVVTPNIDTSGGDYQSTFE